MNDSPNLVLYNARVITLDNRQPTAEVVAIKGDRIARVGSRERLALGRSRSIDCRGQTVAPGFIDSHCHIMAYATSLLAVDCGPSALSSIAEIKTALGSRAFLTPPGRWVRGSGYSEFDLQEKRHPSRWDLDDAVLSHPVRLNHRSGHACVLNSAALARVGISRDTPDPPGGVIERDWETGEPTGLLMEMDGYLKGRIPHLDERQLNQAAQLASQRLVSLGITSAQDATHSNSPERWDAFRRLKAEGSLAPRVTMMAGSDRLEGFLERGLSFGSGDDDVRLGHVKIMLTTTAGHLTPSQEGLRDLVCRAHEAGFPAAIHAVEAESVGAAVNALAAARHATPGQMRDRIEHCSECPPALLERLAGSGVAVATQPSFLYYSGRRYLSQVPHSMQPWLYRIGSFLRAGLSPAAGSDAPVTEPNPLVGMYAAVTRRADSGETVGESERVSAMDALRMYTLNGAYSSLEEANLGSIEVGKLADLVVLDEDPTQVEPERIRNINVTMTVIGGDVVWQA